MAGSSPAMTIGRHLLPGLLAAGTILADTTLPCPTSPKNRRNSKPGGRAAWKTARPADIAATRAMIEKIRAVYELYGFEPVETPAIEYTDALGKFLPDQDRPNEGVFSFQDDDEQWLSLRYDLTAPLARYVAENFETLPKPYRSLSLRLGVPQREAGTGTLPPVHAVRCRHGGISARPPPTPRCA